MKYLKAVGKWAWGFLKAHKEEIVSGLTGALLGSSIALATPGCGGMSSSDHMTKTSVWAVGVPGVAILREAHVNPDNRGSDNNAATQVNTIDVEPKLK